MMHRLGGRHVGTAGPFETKRKRVQFAIEIDRELYV
jgi:hypothetical protein